jgi:hypothetical protein
LVAQATGRIARRTDGKYFLYLPKHLVEDSAFPFDLESSVPVKVIIDRDGEKLLIMPVKSDRTQRRNRR